MKEDDAESAPPPPKYARLLSECVTFSETQENDVLFSQPIGCYSGWSPGTRYT